MGISSEAPSPNTNRDKVTGSICGVKVEAIQDPLLRDIRVLDKLVDELAKGKAPGESTAEITRSKTGTRRKPAVTREGAEKELCRLLEEAEADIRAGRTIPAEEVFARLRGKGSLPGTLSTLPGTPTGGSSALWTSAPGGRWSRRTPSSSWGDAGLNFYGGRRDALGKEQLAKLPCTFFCIHGNHEQRPGPELGYELSSYHGGQVWVQPQYPNIVFAIDGEVYDFCGHSCLVIGGAYSIDKHYRLAMGVRLVAR